MNINKGPGTESHRGILMIVLYFGKRTNKGILDAGHWSSTRSSSQPRSKKHLSILSDPFLRLWDNEDARCWGHDVDDTTLRTDDFEDKIDKMDKICKIFHKY